MTGRGKAPMRTADPARLAAYDVLRAVSVEDAYAPLVLPGLLADRRLTGRDAALATELTYGALRWTGTLDLVLADCLDRGLDLVDSAVLDVLRLGAYQLLLTRVPPHAAVSTTVDLAHAAVGAGPARLVNAVLRRVGTADLATWVEQLAPAAVADPLDRLAVEHAHPRWIVDGLADALGGDLAETEAMLAADNARPSVTLVARPGRCDPADLLRVPGSRAGRWSPYAVVLGSGAPQSIPYVRRGDAGVQDEGSQVVTLALAAADVDGPESRWLDLCAGPGGKAALLAALAAPRGVELTAHEVSDHRARLVESALAGSPGRHRVVVGDGTVPEAAAAWAPGGYDRVLVDAPCSGLGALRRRPESRWRRTPDDLDALAPLQRALLSRAVDAVRPGGLVAYVTCSPLRTETVDVVDDVLAARRDVARDDARAALARAVPDLAATLDASADAGPDVQVWPHRHGTDAMYLALLRRR